MDCFFFFFFNLYSFVLGHEAKLGFSGFRQSPILPVQLSAEINLLSQNQSFCCRRDTNHPWFFLFMETRGLAAKDWSDRSEKG